MSRSLAPNGFPAEARPSAPVSPLGIPTEAGPSRIKVLHISEAFGGGVASVVEGYVRSTPQHQHVIWAFRRPNHQIGDIADLGVPFVDLPPGRLRQLLAVRTAVRTEQPDLIHAHSSFAGVYGRVVANGVPMAYTPHCMAFERTDVRPSVRTMFRLVERLLARRTAVFIANGQRESQLCNEIGAGRPVMNCPYTPRMVEDAPPAVAIRLSPSPMEVMVVGRLGAQKGVDFAAATALALGLGATSSTPAPIRIRWIGDGPDDQRQTLADAGVEVIGWRTRPQVLEELRSVDVYLHTAAWEAAIPVSLLEAADAGIPIVARSIPGLSDTELELVDTPQEAADALIRCLDVDERRAMARASLALVERVTAVSKHPGLDAAYRAAIASRPRAEPVADDVAGDRSAEHDAGVATAGYRGDRVAANAAWMAGAELVGKISTLAYTLVAARELARSQFGAFAFALAFATLLSAGPSWGFDALLIQRGSAVGRRRVSELLAETAILRVLIAVPLFLIGGGAALLTRPSDDARIALCLVLAAIAGDLYGDGVRSAAAALHDQRGMSVALILQRFTTAALALGALTVGRGRIGTGAVVPAAAYFIGSLVGAVGVAIVGRRLGIRPKYRRVTKAGVRDTLRRSTSLGMTTIVGYIIFRFDAVFLAATRGDSDLAVYMVAYRVFETSLVFSWTIGRAILPRMSADATSAVIARGLRSGLGVLSLLYLPMAAFLVVDGASLISIVFGEQYSQSSIGPLRALALGPIAFGVWQIGGFALVAAGRSRTAFRVSAIAMVANIVGNLVFTGRYGGISAALATTGAYVLGAGLTIRSLTLLIGRIHVWRVLLPGLLAAVAVATVCSALTLPALVEGTVAAVVAYLVWALSADLAPADSIELLVALRKPFSAWSLRDPGRADIARTPAFALAAQRLGAPVATQVAVPFTVPGVIATPWPMPRHPAAGGQLVARPDSKCEAIAGAQLRIEHWFRSIGAAGSVPYDPEHRDDEVVRVLATEIHSLDTQEVGTYFVYIRVFGDGGTDPSSALRTSHERASRLHDSLVAAGVRPTRVVTTGFGQPLTEGRRRNDAKLHVQFL